MLLTACNSQAQPSYVERIALDVPAEQAVDPILATPNPDTEGGRWQTIDDAGSIGFGFFGARPMFLMACEPIGNGGPQVRFVRNAAADAGARALMAVIGNRRVARIKMDAHSAPGARHWEGTMPASDMHMEAFAGGGPLEVTLPGAGSLSLPASEQPAQLLSRCRRSGLALPPASAPD